MRIPRCSKISNLESNLSEKKNGDRCGSIAAWLNSRTRAEISIASLRWMRSEAVACNSIWNAFGNADSRCLGEIARGQQPPDVSWCHICVANCLERNLVEFLAFPTETHSKTIEFRQIQNSWTVKEWYVWFGNLLHPWFALTMHRAEQKFHIPSRGEDLLGGPFTIGLNHEMTVPTFQEILSADLGNTPITNFRFYYIQCFCEKEGWQT